MNLDILISNLTNPTLLFFVLGIVAVIFKSDLEIPPSSAKFISIYLLIAIGFKGGQELAHSHSSMEMAYAIVFGLLLAAIIPLIVFFIMKRRVPIVDAGALAATYGSVSAVTFVSAIAFLESIGVSYSGYMVAIMALMEAPSIVMGVFLIGLFDAKEKVQSLRSIVFHALTNGSVLVVLGSLVIGGLADVKQAEAFRPFTTDMFKGFLSIFLLDMGMVTARRISAFKKYGAFVPVMGLALPCVIGISVAVISHWVLSSHGDRLMITILAASASYIAVPAAMRLAAPKADPGLYLPMALGVTFPFNIAIGIPLFWAIIHWF